jgi:hypothetical protein
MEQSIFYLVGKCILIWIEFLFLTILCFIGFIWLFSVYCKFDGGISIAMSFITTQILEIFSICSILWNREVNDSS